MAIKQLQTETGIPLLSNGSVSRRLSLINGISTLSDHLSAVKFSAPMPFATIVSTHSDSVTGHSVMMIGQKRGKKLVFICLYLFLINISEPPNQWTGRICIYWTRLEVAKIGIFISIG
jgi:hypothetical protein